MYTLLHTIILFEAMYTLYRCESPQLCDEDTQHICKSGSTKQRHCYPFNGATAISLCRRNCEQRKQVCEGLYMLSLHFVAMITPYLILELLDKD